MKVLQVHTTYRQAGGEDGVVRSDADLLTAAGVEVVTHQASNPDGPAAIPALALSPWNPVAARAAERVVRREQPDVAHLHNTWFAMSPAVPAAIARCGVPVVATLHNYRRVCANASLFRDGRACTDCVGGTAWPGVRHACYRGSRTTSAVVATGIELNRRFRLMDRSVDLFLVLNEFMLEVFVRGGLDPARAVLKPNWVPDPGARLRPPSDSRTVVTVGRVERFKGIDVLVRAWAEAAPELELLVVGEGDDRAELEALGVPGVTFTGHLPRDEVRRLLLTARALLLPTVLSEGQPLTALEAMAAGTPLLASRGGGTPALLADVDGRWLLPPGDARAWAAGLRWLAEADHRLLDETGRRLRGRFERSHDEAAGLRGLLEAYARVRA